MNDVVIVGAGPVGLMLACELRLAGIDPLVVERLPERLTTPKANGLTGQVVRLLDQRGLYGRVSGVEGAPHPGPEFIFGAIALPLNRLEHNPMYFLPVPQRELERHFGERAAELGVEVRRGVEITGFVQDAEGVTLEVATEQGPDRLQARYVAGCDGGHSTIRKVAGIGFPGATEDDVVSRMAYISPASYERLSQAAPQIEGLGVIYHRTETGVFTLGQLVPGRPLVNTLEWEEDPDRDWPGEGSPMTMDEMQASVGRVLGVDVALAPPPDGPQVLRRLVGRNTRLAERYRAGRVFLAGDAAHVHSASGGPGLNLGLQDAANLAWKLAAAVQGWAPDDLLDTYETERRALGSRVFMQTQSQTALMAPGSSVTALRDLFGELLERKENLQAVADLMAGADVRYDMGDPGAPRPTGWFVPDIRLADGGPDARLAELLRDGRPTLVDLAGDERLRRAVEPWTDRVAYVKATAVDAPAPALLIRPDGYVAWSGGASGEGLTAALRRWFGAAA